MDADDLPLVHDAPLRSHPDFQPIIRFFEANGFFGPDAASLYKAVVALIASGDADSGEMLNYMFEAGLTRRLDDDADVPLVIVASKAWTSPAYTDILSTLIEFHFDFDSTVDAAGVSARSIVEERAPGIFKLLTLKAHLVTTGAWPDVAGIVS